MPFIIYLPTPQPSQPKNNYCRQQATLNLGAWGARCYWFPTIIYLSFVVYILHTRNLVLHTFYVKGWNCTNKLLHPLLHIFVRLAPNVKGEDFILPQTWVIFKYLESDCLRDYSRVEIHSCGHRMDYYIYQSWLDSCNYYVLNSEHDVVQFGHMKGFIYTGSAKGGISTTLPFPSPDNH